MNFWCEWTAEDCATKAIALVLEFLQRHPKDRGILIAAATRYQRSGSRASCTGIETRKSTLPLLDRIA